MHFAPTIYSDYLLPWSAMNLFVHGFLKVKIMIKNVTWRLLHCIFPTKLKLDLYYIKTCFN